MTDNKAKLITEDIFEGVLGNLPIIHFAKVKPDAIIPSKREEDGCEAEIWLPVKNYEGLYEVSNLGQVRSLGRIVDCVDGRIRRCKGKVMSQSEGGKRESADKGYKQVRLTDEYKNSKTCNVHRLVAEAFIPNTNEKETVNHIDGDKHNNNSDNLEWATNQENLQHAVESDLHNCNIPIFMLDEDSRILKVFKSIHEAGRQTGINYRNIQSVCVGRRITAGGFRWSYASESNMSDKQVLFAKVREGAKIPSKKESDGCYDVYACFDEDFMLIYPNAIKLIPTGIASAFSSKYRFDIRERGSTGTKGMSVRAGQIDSGFRGEWFIAINNTTNKPIYIAKNSAMTYLSEISEFATLYPYEKAICQVALEEVPKVQIKEIQYKDLKNIASERGVGMLGSSQK